MPGVYRVSLPSVALSLSADTVTIIAGTKPLRILYGDCKGHGAAPAANSVRLARSSGGTTPGGAITPVKVSTDMPTAGFTVYTTWSAQPTLGEVLHRFEVNANGGVDKYTAFPGFEIYLEANQQISLRSEAGTSNVLVNFEIMEG